MPYLDAVTFNTARWIALTACAVFGLAVATRAQAEPIDPCEGSPKGTSQTPAGMCIDGVLFKDVLARLAAVEAQLLITSATLPQGKPER
jgi:hypothetical protein